MGGFMDIASRCGVLGVDSSLVQSQWQVGISVPKRHGYQRAFGALCHLVGIYPHSCSTFSPFYYLNGTLSGIAEFGSPFDPISGEPPSGKQYGFLQVPYLRNTPVTINALILGSTKDKHWNVSFYYSVRAQGVNESGLAASGLTLTASINNQLMLTLPISKFINFTLTSFSFPYESTVELYFIEFSAFTTSNQYDVSVLLDSIQIEGTVNATSLAQQ